MGSTDIDMVKTIVRNLVSNAVKFSYEKGVIAVSTKTDGDFVVVSVKDSGKGIKKEDQGKHAEAKHYILLLMGRITKRGPAWD